MIRRALVSLAITSAAAALLLVIVLRQADAPPPAVQAPLLDLSIDDVRTLELTNAHGDIQLVWHPDGWWLARPHAFADQDAVASLLHHLSEVRIGSSLPNTEVDLARFGLAPPRARLRLVSAAGAEVELRLGGRNDYHGQVYVQRMPPGTVHLVDGAIAYQLERSVLQWRDRRLWRGTVDDVLALEAKGRWRLTRREGGFEVSDKERVTPADPDRVRVLLSDVVGLRTREVVLETATLPEAEREAGGQAPWQLEITSNTGTRALHLWPAGLAWAGPEGPLVKLSGDAIFGALPQSARDLEDRRLAQLDPQRVQTVVVQGPDGTFTLKRLLGTHEPPQWEWQQASEHGAASAAEVFALIYKLSHLKAEAVDHEPPRWETLGAIRVLAADDAVLADIKLGPKTMNHWWVKVDQRVVALPLARAEALPLTLNVYRTP